MARRADDEPDSLERALAPRRGHRWRALALGALVLAVCAAVFGAISSRSLFTAYSPTVRPAVHHNQPCPARVTSRPTEITIQPDDDGIGLVQNLAWSPLGTCIAVLATQTTRSGAPGPPLLATYAPTTGTLLSLVPLTTALTRALAGDPRATASLSGLSVEYGDPLWLPDGQHVVITVTALTPDELTPRLAGVLLVDDQGLQPYQSWCPREARRPSWSGISPAEAPRSSPRSPRPSTIAGTPMAPCGPSPPSPRQRLRPLPPCRPSVIPLAARRSPCGSRDSSTSRWRRPHRARTSPSPVPMSGKPTSPRSPRTAAT